MTEQYQDIDLKLAATQSWAMKKFNCNEVCFQTTALLVLAVMLAITGTYVVWSHGGKSTDYHDPDVMNFAETFQWSILAGGIFFGMLILSVRCIVRHCFGEDDLDRSSPRAKRTRKLKNGCEGSETDLLLSEQESSFYI